MTAHPPPDPDAPKTAWRRWIAAHPDPDPRAVARVVAELTVFASGLPDGPVAAYLPVGGEVDLGFAAEPAPLVDGRGVLGPAGSVPDATARLALALPRLDGDVLTWRLPTRPERHPLGFVQPGRDDPEIAPGELVAVFVPGRCFDRHGVRLGRGGGHYDRALALVDASAPRVGVTTSDRVVDRLPSEPHDLAMTHLATDAGVHPVP